MLLAIKLLVLLGVLSYAVSAVLAEQSLSMAFQAPLSRYLARRGGDQHEDSLTLSTVRTASAVYSKRPPRLRDFKYHPRRTVFAEQLIDNSSIVITTVDGLRVRHGEGTWWGDLNHVETRFVYHQLLPKQLLRVAQEREDVSVEELARAASEARHAARIYARERSSLPLRLLAGLYDGFRTLKSHGRWSWTGMTYEQLWDKYERQIQEETGGQVEAQELNRRVALRILHKSCQTNPRFDRLGSVDRAHEILQRAAATEQRRMAARWLAQRRRREEQEARAAAAAAAGGDPAWLLQPTAAGAQEQQQQAPVRPAFDTLPSSGRAGKLKGRVGGHLSGLMGYFGKISRADLM